MQLCEWVNQFGKGKIQEKIYQDEFFTELWNDKVNYFYILYIYGCIESILANIVVKFNKRIDIFHFISIFIDICIYYIIKSILDQL